jgi:hypothetical protein
MPDDITSFHSDINSPGGGTNSELYRAIAPMLDIDRIPVPKNVYDRDRIEKLKEDLRKGSVGFEYLTKLKNNKVETFYDNHPIQAVTSNILNNSAGIGAGVALGTPVINGLRQWRNLAKTENAYHARRSDEAQKAENKLVPTGKEGRSTPVTDQETLNLFGSAHPDEGITAGGQKYIANEDALKRRAKTLDMVDPAPKTLPKGKAGAGVGAFTADLNKVLKMPKGPGRSVKLNKLMYNTRGTDAQKALVQWAELNKDLSEGTARKLKGGFGSSVGDRILSSDLYQKGIDALPEKYAPGAKAVINSLIPHSFKGIEDLTTKRIHQQGINYSPDMMKKLVSHNLKGLTDSQKKVIERGLLENLNNPNMGRSSVKLLKMLGPGALAGAGIAGAGMGLNSLLKLIQSKVYGPEQIADWKRNSLKARGEFEEAQKIK